MDNMDQYLTRATTFILMNGVDSYHYGKMDTNKDRIRCALEHLLNYEVPPIIHRTMKSREKAIEYIDKVKEYSRASWKIALELHTLAVINAPPDSKELALAYASRSEALYNGGLYDDSLSDIERALNIGYADDLKATLYARRACCFFALDGTVSEKVKEAMAESCNWLEKMNDDDKHFVNNVLNKLIVSNFNVTKAFPKVDCNKIFPQPSDNSKILRASSAIELKYTRERYRHMIATRDIEINEILLVHKTYASVIEPNFMRHYCWNCTKRAWSGVPCNECVSVIYCSETCRDIAWQNYHDIECPVIPQLLSHKLSVKELMILRLTVKAYKEAGTVENLEKKHSDINATRDQIMNTYFGNVFDETKYESVYTFIRTWGAFTFLETIRCAIILFYLATSTEILNKKVENVPDILSNDSAMFIGELILHHSHILRANCITLSSSDYRGFKFNYGCAVMPFTNLFNHSCDPGAMKVVLNDTAAVVTLQKIKKGEEIFISYGDISLFKNKSKSDRRTTLVNHYRVLCECRACDENWTMSSFKYSVTNGKSWANCLNKQLKSVLPAGLNPFRYTMPDIVKIHSSISKILNTEGVHQETYEYPNKEIIMLKSDLIKIYEAITTILTII